MSIIEVNSISKKYNLSTRKGPLSIREGFFDFFKNEKKEEFWAVNDVSFNLEKGDKLGIIGNNGAGKSTLLKILSKITQPTSGKIYVQGKVASLLEVGTGFHPELTGRENIFLNGAILGMSKKEISSQFDEIVDFAGGQIAQFLDTPVKRYSSGMYVRLGFAISAHLNPDILIVDEVLAVGDADFQKKSLGKMREVASKEKTILFVSHNLTAVANLCNKTLHMEKGRVKEFGDTGTVLTNYLATLQNNVLKKDFKNINDALGNDLVRLKSAELKPNLFENQSFLDIRNSFDIQIEFWNLEDNQNLNISLHLYASTGECIFNIGTEPQVLNKGIVKANAKIPGNFLNDGNYFISFMIVKDKSIILYNFEEIFNFEIADFREDTTWYGKWPGYVRPNFDFKIIQQTEVI
jgi:lipopolysaccharide transport system ATP-binding protein